MNAELNAILQKFIQSGWPLIAGPASAWMLGKLPKHELLASIERARKECGGCGCEYDALYPRALELLQDEPEGWRYEKLVRDRIPEIIKSQGYAPRVRVLSDEAYLRELHRKLREEVEEYLAEENQEELADILEVLQAICSIKGFAWQDVLRLQDEKRAKRGGFQEKLYLISKD